MDEVSNFGHCDLCIAVIFVVMLNVAVCQL